MISISNLAKYYGDRVLFEDVSMQFNRGERYGIVGANGCGKSTLLKILTGEESASDGDVSIPKKAVLGVLEQDHFQYESERIVDVVMMGNRALWAAMAEKEKILANAETEFDGDRYAELEDLVIQHDGYGLEARAGEILEGLGIPTHVHDQPLSTLSGGFKLRVLLAQVLAAEPDALLLDEPTNHLDIEVDPAGWKSFLLDTARRRGSSDHSRPSRFLDKRLATRIVELDRRRALFVAG